MRNFIITIFITITLISFSITYAGVISANQIDNFEKIQNQDNGEENNNNYDEDSKNDTDDSYTPEESDGKDRTN